MVVGDTPETVELRGMVNLLDAAKEQLGSSDGKVVWAADGSGLATSWGRCAPCSLCVGLGPSTIALVSPLLRFMSQSGVMSLSLPAA